MCARQLVHSLSQFMLALLFICMLSYNLSFKKIFYPLLVSLLSSLKKKKGRYFVLKCFSYYVVLPFGFAHSSGLINCVMLSHSCPLAPLTLDVQAIDLISKHGLSAWFNCSVSDRILQQDACNFLQEDAESSTFIPSLKLPFLWLINWILLGRKWSNFYAVLLC